jgi:enoyl-CoA hydratase
MSEPSGGELFVQHKDAVLTITLNRPERLNAVTADQLADLADLLEETADDARVRVVVLTGAGRAFSSGADISPGADPDPATVDSANRVVATMQRMPQPTIAWINGVAAGVGCSLALGADLVVAADTAYLLLPFTSIGLMPDGGATALVPASVGRARAMGMALLAERVPAPLAYEWGLVTKVVPTDQLAGEVERLARKLADGAPLALAQTKFAVNAATMGSLAPAMQRERREQEVLLGSDDFREGVTAFGERRPPKFTGR